MKNKFTFLYKAFFILFISFLYLGFSSNPPNGLTGAPGDGTCNNCHSGGTQTGSVDIEGITDNPVIANKTYNVTVRISLTSGSSSRAGFAFVALDGNTAVSPSTGSFSNLGTNVGTATSGSRTYTEHSGGENTYSGGDVTYTFDWTAPASSTDNISFYTVANIANGSGVGGDLIVFDSDQNIPLPVELVDFDLHSTDDNQVELRWETASEKNSASFEILRSENSKDYESIGEVTAAGFSDDQQYYTFVDEEPILNRNSFYRLKQIDIDGQFAYSAIEVIQAQDFEEHYINIFPNPARNGQCLFIDYISESSHPDAQVRIYDIHGRSVIHNPEMDAGIQKGFNKYVIDLNQLPIGQYFLSITDKGNMLEGRSFVVAK